MASLAIPWHTMYMTDVASLLQYIQNLPVLSILSGIVALFWALFSFAITYHWLVYSRNLVISIIILILYYGISLFLIGSILENLSYV